MFGFPIVEHKIYKNNFLRNVVLIFNFSKVDINDIEKNLKTRFADFFPQFNINKSKEVSITFGNDSGVVEHKNNEEQDVYNFRSKTGNSVLTISSNSFVLNYNGAEYISYKNISALIKSLLELAIEDLKIEEFANVSFRKLNVLEVNSPEEVFLGDISYNAHNTHIKYVEKVPESNFVLNDYRNITLQNLEEKATLHLKYGLNSPLNVPGKINHLFIDSNIIVQDISSVNINEKLKIVNNELFNIFNWVISQQLVKLLENDQISN